MPGSGAGKARAYTLLGFALVAILFASSGNAQTPAAQPSPAQPQPTRMALLPFEVPFFYFDANRLSSFVTDMVEESLFNTGHYRLVDRRTLLQVLREQGIGVTDLADPRTAAQIGKILGVQVLVTGSINAYELQNLGTFYGSPMYRAVARLTARAVNAETTEVLGIARGAGEARGLHPPTARRKAVGEIALEQAVKELAGKLDAALQKGR